MKILSFHFLRAGFVAGVGAIATVVSVQAGNPAKEPIPETKSSSALEDWWNGKYATGNWFGLRDTLEDHGVAFDGKWRGTFYGLTGGGLDSPRGAFDEEIVLGLKLDFGKLAGIDGLTAQGSVRWRDGRSPNTYVGAGSLFNPSRYQSGQQWRLMPFFLTYTTPELFGVKDLLTISGGWQNPYDFFADQPDSKLFTNNSIGTQKGVGSSGVGWGSSYAAWGGFLKVKPVEWYYAMAGLYLAIPNATSLSNHGLDLQGYAPDPSANGLYALGETGVTPKIGPAELPGKYAFGGMYFGVENTSYYGEKYDGRYDLYWQADQMVFREPSKAAEAPLAKGPTNGKEVAGDGKSFKEPVPTEKPKLSDQGLYVINFINFAPAYNSPVPFYFHTGLIYKGLIPTRDKDQLGVAFAYGNYSYNKLQAEDNAGTSVHQTYEAVIEADYRVQVTKFTYVQPFWQYIIRPNGTGLVQNANIFGLHMGVAF